MQLDKQTMTSYFLFLDELRKSGKINMYASPSYIAEGFHVPIEDAKKIFMKWNDTFTEEPAFVRATRAVGEI